MSQASVAEGRHREAGLSLIEVLIAMGIMLMIALGVLPLFARSIVNNQAGRDSSVVNNVASSDVESLMRMPFDDPSLTIPAGQTQLVTYDYWDEDTGALVNVANQAELDAAIESSSIQASYGRVITIQQYASNDLATPLDGATPPLSVHLKEIRVNIQPGRTGGVLGAGKSMNLRLYRSF